MAAYFDELTVCDAGVCRPVPDWARAYVDLGARCASHITTLGRLIVAAALPTRAYAAAFVGAGIVLQRASEWDEKLEATAHYEYLRALLESQGDVAVDVKDGRNESLPGRLVGLSSEADGQYLVIRTQKGLTKFLHPAAALRVQPRKRKAAARRERIVRTGYEFLGAVLAGSKPADFAMKTRFECAIVGTRSQLRHEIVATPFSLGGHSGHLQDVLRVREFQPEGAPFRTGVISDRVHASAEGDVPHAVIFDGASAFLNWRDDWPDVPWIALLDRTEGHFEEAAAQVNVDFLQRVDDALSLEIPFIPPGVELIAFEAIA